MFYIGNLNPPGKLFLSGGRYFAKSGKSKQMRKSKNLKKFIQPLTLFLLIFSLFITLKAQQKSSLWGSLTEGKYKVGYKVFDEKDFSRSFVSASESSYITAARPMKISLWYPAKITKNNLAPVKFRQYLHLMENALTETAKRRAEENFKTSYPASGFDDKALSALMNISGAAYPNAEALAGRFPVVLFGHGLYFESPAAHIALCEFLASRGFVVATTDLKGWHSPFVKLDEVDLEAAIRDLEFVLSRARLFPNADSEKTGVIGFDLGGLAGLILTMRNPSIDAYISLDSGITAAHNLRLVKSMPDYNPLAFRVPLLHLTHPVEELKRFNVSEDASFIDEAARSDRLILRFPNTRHADFTLRPMIEFFAANQRDDITAYRRNAFELSAQTVLAFFQTHLQNDQESREFLYGENFDGKRQKIKIERELKPAPARMPPSENEFVGYLYAEGAEKTAQYFGQLRRQFPGERIFREKTLELIGFNRLYRGLASEAIRIFTINAEAYPNSTAVYENLGQAHALAGKREDAIRFYKKSLEINPANESVKARLKQLEEEGNKERNR